MAASAAPGRRARLRPALVLGLDGATFDVIRPLAAAGRLPNLAAWMAEGLHAPLPSTVPPMTFPAWSSFLTGLGPGRHGIFDFTQKLPGRYRIRFVNATDRHGASLFASVCRAGGRVLALGMPATFPPESLDGLLVCGFDAPVSTGSDASMASDPALYREIAARVGAWMRPDLDESACVEGWHERAATALLARIERKTRFALEAMARLREGGRQLDLAVIVFSESDTVAHHFWRDHDPRSPRHDPGAGAVRRDTVSAVYERLDAACGALRHAFGEDALCLVVSDHGSGGAARRVVHLNQRLAECGLLTRAPTAHRPALDDLARRARDAALRALPPAAAQALFRRLRPAAARIESAARFGGIRFGATAAFSEEVNTQPGVWLNLRGREARGAVQPADAERVRRQVIEALLDWKLPGGAPVVARALPREEVYEGPFAGRAPDVVVELALDEGYGLSVVATPWQGPGLSSVRTLEDFELAGGRGRGMNGVHRPEGVFVASGPGAPAPPNSLAGVAPALLATMGAASDASREGVGGAQRGTAARPYTDDQEQVVAKRLRGLGYLE